jgi:uncharacterized membrane protein
MSFIKNLDEFLSEAKAAKVIDSKTQDKLRDFAQKRESKSGMGMFLNIVGFFGGLAIILGLILVISHNWSQISSVIKITVYVATLIGLYFSAIRLAQNHSRLSEVIYFITAGYVLAGIGLIAQIYHLSSTNGTAFLVWFVLILPLALILRNKWIGVMAMFAFYLWVQINAGDRILNGNIKNAVIYFTTMASSMILFPRVMKQVNNCFDHVRIFGVILLLPAILALGFIHEMPLYTTTDLNINPITSAILIFNMLVLGYMLIASKETGIYQRSVAFLLLVINLLPFLISGMSAPLIAIFYWIVWFYFGGILIYQGAAEENKSMINYGTWCVMIGIIIRFIDLVGTMLFTGAMFILFGAILIGVAYVGEKYRKNLINKINSAHVKQKK